MSLSIAALGVSASERGVGDKARLLACEPRGRWRPVWRLVRSPYFAGRSNLGQDEISRG